MAKQGRPGIPYEKFVEVWESLIEEGRAGTNAAHDILGGSKSTIASYREKYERERSASTLSILKDVELPKAVQQAIADIKVKELDSLQKENVALKSRIDEHLSLLKKAEDALATAKVEFNDAKVEFDTEKLSLERKLAAAQARIDDLESRESKLLERYEKQGEQLSRASQDAAVAKKEVELLREKDSEK